jgi:hypothetical protein
MGSGTPGPNSGKFYIFNQNFFVMSNTTLQKLPVQRGPVQIIQLALLAGAYWLLLKGYAAEWWFLALIGLLFAFTAYTLWQEGRSLQADTAGTARMFFWTKVVAFVVILGLLGYQFLGA